MEKTIEIKAIDKENAVKRALNILGIEKNDNLNINITEKEAPRKKLFGLFGTEPGLYEVSVTEKINEKPKKEVKENKEVKKEKIEKEINKEKIEKLENNQKTQNNDEYEKEISEKVDFFVKNMKLDIKYKIRRIKDRVFVVDFFGTDNAIVIGQKGKTLNSLEYLLNNLIRDCKIEVDVEKFKEKRNETLRSLARKMAEKVSKTGKTIRLNSMPPRERKIIHEVVNKYSDLDTFSEGRDPKRYIVIKKKR